MHVPDEGLVATPAVATFGGPPKTMTAGQAKAAVDFLFANAEPRARVHVSFLGGEPLTSRDIVREATAHAERVAALQGCTVGFSITTNGTLLTESDAAFFEDHAFSVTISLDGLRAVHDRNRPLKIGTGTFDRILCRARPLLERQRRMQVSVRSTVTPGNARLRESVDEFLGHGFHSVGFSPLLRSPAGTGEMAARDLEAMLAALIECGDEFQRRVARGERYGFANMVNAMRELHRGTHRPYPCGAGAGYLGVSADGALAACHRFVGDEAGAMGSIAQGIDRAAQHRWLAERHVDRQEPCRNCWARYLCGGGCHHEVIGRGRPACDFIRGWLDYCVRAYLRLAREAPAWLPGARKFRRERRDRLRRLRHRRRTSRRRGCEAPGRSRARGLVDRADGVPAPTCRGVSELRRARRTRSARVPVRGVVSDRDARP